MGRTTLSRGVGGQSIALARLVSCCSSSGICRFLNPRLEPSQRPVRLDETLLRRVLGVGGGPGDDVGGAESDLLIAFHDLLIGGRVAAHGARDQDGIVRWPALHRNASCTPAAASWFPCNRGALGWV